MTLGLILAGLWWVDWRDPAVFAAGWFSHIRDRPCTLIKVVDGDSLVVSCDGEPVEVRLYCIDAPEWGQKPWGKQAKRHLRQIAPRDLRLREIEKDRFGRTVAEVYSAGPDRLLLNLEQVANGHAAVYDRYCDDPRFFKAEDSARQAGLGIWSRPGDQQTPWVYRHGSSRR